MNSKEVIPSTSDNRPSAAAFDTIIRIRVGQDAPQIFEVHKGVLKFYSGYFRAAIDNVESGRFKEAEDNMITLPEEKAEVFKLFQGWLYTRELPKDKSTDLVKLWGLADRRIVPLLQNEAIDAIQVHNYKNWKEACPTTVYRNTGADSALRRFTVCSYAANVSILKDTQIVGWPEEFKTDLIQHLLTVRPKMDPDEFKRRDMCEWHVHEEGVRCKKE
ncbi:hypothetical protein HII31_09761 [Pseudocercospora fuligena]|uniref:BTB domain-containing protein n=1 Tax=Pseudocercospora fuligena TaxID=685502 RepID=A0A8H6RD26_9PEZI|nr:hypothetical protein HII31_09761 [Pseudocercospora fuligena]